MVDPIASHPLRILVVDDDEAVRELIEWMLQEAGHRAYVAADGREALLTSGQPPPSGTGNFLPKPFRWDALTSAIMRLVDPSGHLGQCA